MVKLSICFIKTADKQGRTWYNIIVPRGTGKPAGATRFRGCRYKMKVINKNGTQINYDAAVQLMDDDLREELHAKIAPCTEQEFFTAYEVSREEKFGEEWEISKENPCL